VTAQVATKLYSSALLGLATGLADYPLDPTLPLKATVRSRSCGSVLTLGLAVDASERIARIGMQVSACAIGQASAAVLAQGCIGASPLNILATANGLERWLAGESDLPPWPGLEPLIPALAHPGRHGALLLPWNAACEALSHTAP
jgi:NifU-like protein involved in Fe-S cluster formation